MLTIPLSSVNEGDRARKDYGDLEGLKTSLHTLGSIHPIVLSKNDRGSYDLVAGGRRFRSAKELGTTELTHASVLEPGRIGFLFRDEVPTHVLKEAELDENLFRLKPKWTEDVLLIADVHALKREKLGTGEWGVEQTAELLGKGYGKTKVSHAVRLAKEIRAGNKEILSAENMSDAVAIMVKRKEDEALAEMNKRAVANVVSGGTSSFLDSLNINLGGPKKFDDAGCIEATAETSPSIVGSNPTVVTTSPEVSAPTTVPLSRMFVLGDSLKIMSSLPDGSFHHIVTDIPYGIDMKNLDTRDMTDVATEHDVDQNVSMMQPFLAQAFRLVRSGGFCVFFYDLDWHEYLQTTAEALGWKVQRWPLIAHKTSTCQNNAAQYNFTKNYESIMVLRRDESTVLRGQQPTSVWMGDFAAERKLYNNPFAKPFPLWKWLYDAVAFQGQKVLDPFCGEMSACRAAVNCGLTPFGIEINEKHYNRGLENMKAAFALMYGTNVTFS